MGESCIGSGDASSQWGALGGSGGSQGGPHREKGPHGRDQHSLKPHRQGQADRGTRQGSSRLSEARSCGPLGFQLDREALGEASGPGPGALHTLAAGASPAEPQVQAPVPCTPWRQGPRPQSLRSRPRCPAHLGSRGLARRARGVQSCPEARGSLGPPPAAPGLPTLPSACGRGP